MNSDKKINTGGIVDGETIYDNIPSILPPEEIDWMECKMFAKIKKTIDKINICNGE